MHYGLLRQQSKQSVLGPQTNQEFVKGLMEGFEPFVQVQA